MFTSFKSQPLTSNTNLSEPQKLKFKDLADESIIGRIINNNSELMKELYFIENVAITTYSDIDIQLSENEPKMRK